LQGYLLRVARLQAFVGKRGAIESRQLKVNAPLRLVRRTPYLLMEDVRGCL
jgi:hypothetical protein